MRARRPIIVAVASLVVLLMVAIPSQATFAKLYTLNMSPGTVVSGTPGQTMKATYVGKSLFGVGSSTLTPPTGFTITSVQSSLGAGVAGSAAFCPPPSNTKVCVSGMNLTLNKTAIVTMSVNIPTIPCGSATTTNNWGVTAKSTTGATFNTTSGTSLKTFVSSTACASLSIAKSAVSPQVSVGDQVKFDVTVTNAQGGGAASSVGISDTLPNGLDWSVLTQPATGNCVITGSLQSPPETLSCSGLSIASGPSSQFATVKAQALAPGTVTNDGAVATINGDQVAQTPQSAFVDVFETSLPCGGVDNSLDNVTITNPNTDGCQTAIYDAAFDGKEFTLTKPDDLHLSLVVDVNSWAPEKAKYPIDPTTVDPPPAGWCNGTPNSYSMPSGQTWCLITQSAVLAGHDDADGTITGQPNAQLMQVYETWLLEGDAAICRKSSCN